MTNRRAARPASAPAFTVVEAPCNSSFTHYGIRRADGRHAVERYTERGRVWVRRLAVRSEVLAEITPASLEYMTDAEQNAANGF